MPRNIMGVLIFSLLFILPLKAGGEDDKAKSAMDAIISKVDALIGSINNAKNQIKPNMQKLRKKLTILDQVLAKVDVQIQKQKESNKKNDDAITKFKKQLTSTDSIKPLGQSSPVLRHFNATKAKMSHLELQLEAISKTNKSATLTLEIDAMHIKEMIPIVRRKIPPVESTTVKYLTDVSTELGNARTALTLFTPKPYVDAEKSINTVLTSLGQKTINIAEQTRKAAEDTAAKARKKAEDAAAKLRKKAEDAAAKLRKKAKDAAEKAKKATEDAAKKTTDTIKNWFGW